MDFSKATPAELHEFASHYNWDDGYGKLDRLVDSENCALGTALMLYWLGSPYYFRKYEGVSEVPRGERANYKLLRKIESGVREGRFQHHGVVFDPRSDSAFQRNNVGQLVVVDLPADMFVRTTATRVVDVDRPPPREQKKKKKKRRSAKKSTS